MSMDEMLLQELYGSSEVQAEEQIKQAQVELVEAVAAEAGVDLNELSDDELTKFAHYVLSDDDEQSVNTEDQQKLAEADLMGRQMAHSYADELQNIQQGEEMSYNTQEKIASAMGDVADLWLEKIAETDDAVGEIAGETSDAPKSKKGLMDRLKGGAKFVGDQTGFTDYAGDYAGGTKSSLNRNLRRGGTIGAAGLGLYGLHRMRKKKQEKKASFYADYMFEKIAANTDGGDADKKGLMDRLKGGAKFVGDQTGFTDYAGDYEAARKSGLNRNLRRAGTVGAAGLGLYGLHRMRKKKQEKKASYFLDAGYEALALAELYEPEEFAKEAEYRAAEILAANGVHPETFEDIHPEEIKLASFPGVEHAVDAHEAEALAEYNDLLDEAALHIIDQIV